MKRNTFIKSLLGLPFVGKLFGEVEEDRFIEDGPGNPYDPLPDFVYSDSNAMAWYRGMTETKLVDKPDQYIKPDYTSPGGLDFICESVINDDGSITTTYTGVNLPTFTLNP